MECQWVIFKFIILISNIACYMVRCFVVIVKKYHKFVMHIHAYTDKDMAILRCSTLYKQMGEFSASYTQCFCKKWGDCQVKYIIGTWKPHMSCYLTLCNIDMQGAALGLRGCNHLVLGWANSPGTADLVISVCRSVPYMMFNRLAWTNLLYNLVVIHMFHGFICSYLSLFDTSFFELWLIYTIIHVDAQHAKKIFQNVAYQYQNILSCSMQ